MDGSVSGNTVVLCSGFGLGFYVPGLLIRNKLRQLGVSVKVEVFESLLPETKLRMVERNREAYHENFRLALASQKVPTDTRNSIDTAAETSLLLRWEREDRRDFICISGHWVNILDAYRTHRPETTIRADLLYLDVELSPSWKWLRNVKPDYAKGYREVRLYNPGSMDIQYSIDMNSGPPLSFANRDRRLVVHGGGWGIGTYRHWVPAMESAGYGVDVACYGPSEAAVSSAQRRYFMDDPSWRAWHRPESREPTFPPFGRVNASGSATFEPQTECHGLYRLIRSAVGIVSKAGAGTLVDSFGSATPLVLLEPFGPHEERNGRLWLESGFGVPYQIWADAGYPLSMLEALHRNLVDRRSEVKDYALEYARSLVTTR